MNLLNTRSEIMGCIHSLEKFDVYVTFEDWSEITGWVPVKRQDKVLLALRDYVHGAPATEILERLQAFEKDSKLNDIDVEYRVHFNQMPQYKNKNFGKKFFVFHVVTQHDGQKVFKHLCEENPQITAIKTQQMMNLMDRLHDEIYAEIR